MDVEATTTGMEVVGTTMITMGTDARMTTHMGGERKKGMDAVIPASNVVHAAQSAAACATYVSDLYSGTYIHNLQHTSKDW